MALRKILTEEDETLRKTSRPVAEVTDRIRSILDDMAETMHQANGVGLAAPQVGILRRMFVVQVDDGDLYELINPQIVETEGDQYGEEGCLSVPGYVGMVHRPEHVRIKGLARMMRLLDLSLHKYVVASNRSKSAEISGVFSGEISIPNGSEYILEKYSKV